MMETGGERLLLYRVRAVGCSLEARRGAVEIMEPGLTNFLFAVSREQRQTVVSDQLKLSVLYFWLLSLLCCLRDVIFDNNF